MKTSLLSALIFILGLGLAQRASAVEVKWHFKGTVMGSTENTIAVGSPITGTIVYDSNTAPVENFPYQALYKGTSFNISIAGYTAEMSGPDILVTNDDPWGSVFRDAFGCYWDSDLVMSNENFPESLDRVGLELESHFSTGSGPLSDLDLPLSLDLEAFQFINEININGANEMEIDGVIESIILDADGDGVADELDLCPDTPAGKPMKANGCVEGDYDNDGDIDGADLASFSGQFGLLPGF